MTNYCRDTLNEFVSFYVIISPKLQDLDDALYFLWKKNFRIKVFVDRDNAFSEFNNFIPYGEKYHSFLINQDKKIILVGPPNYNKSMWNLYKTTINELQRDARPFVKNY